MLSEPSEAALAPLLRAYELARDAAADPWQLALAVRDLEAAGLALTDARWLVLKKFASLAKEVTTPGDETRTLPRIEYGVSRPIRAGPPLGQLPQ